jgi:hypothetical protein
MTLPAEGSVREHPADPATNGSSAEGPNAVGQSSSGWLSKARARHGGLRKIASPHLACPSRPRLPMKRSYIS